MPEFQSLQKVSSGQKGRTLSECFAFLDAVLPVAYEQKVLERTMLLSKALDNPGEKLDTVIVGGSSGKGTTVFFASKLFQEEGFRVGTIFASQVLSYHERICINDEPVSNKLLAEVLNEVIDASLKNGIQATAFEILLLAGQRIFEKEGVGVSIVEVGIGGRYDATATLKSLVCGITRVTRKHSEYLGEDLDIAACEMMSVVRPGCWLISAEQSKIRLQKMKLFAEQNKLNWSMPVRKLSPLPYIYEQLFGKEASLAERMVQIFVENIKGSFSPFLRGNLLATQKGQRGRPTLEAKRNSELNPLKTIKGFWAEHFKLKHGVFEILAQEKPTILLDESDDIESLDNVFLGLRLLHYKNPIVGACLILGLSKDVNAEEVLKLARYLFKKVSGEIFFVPLVGKDCYSPNELAGIAKTLNIRSRAFECAKEAFSNACQVVDERDGVVCLTGDSELVSCYWKQIREIKKFQS